MVGLDERLDLGFAALADPTRRELLSRIVAQPRRANDLCTGLPMSRPAVSRHLRVLREAGLVEAKKRGREQVYWVSPLGIREVQVYLEEIGRGWERALEAFKRYAEEER